MAADRNMKQRTHEATGVASDISLLGASRRVDTLITEATGVASDISLLGGGVAALIAL